MAEVGGSRSARGPVLDVPIRGGAIPLGALLKLAQAVQSGGEAKMLVQQGAVRVNGAVETRRRHLVVPGDRIDLPDGRTVRVTSADPSDS